MDSAGDLEFDLGPPGTGRTHELELPVRRGGSGIGIVVSPQNAVVEQSLQVLNVAINPHPQYEIVTAWLDMIPCVAAECKALVI